MKVLLAAGLTALCFLALHMSKTGKIKRRIMAAYAGVMILLFILYNYRTIDLILPMYQPKDQTFYQREFMENGLYPDAVLPYIFKGKTVYVKNDRYDDVNRTGLGLVNGEKFDENNKYYLYHHHHFVNEVNFLNASNIKRDTNNAVNTDEIALHFEDLGYANDMYRNMFMLTDGVEEWWNAFYYYWYYNYYFGEIDPDGMHFYICSDGVDTEDELVLLWNDEESKDLFLMSKSTYDKEVGSR